MNATRSFLYHLLVDSPRRWHPILGVYYLTYACPFRCPHCSDGAGQPYYQLRSSVLPAAEALRLLARMRQHCEYLVITGGEPLQHPEIRQVIAGLQKLRFRGVTLTTNGHDLHLCLSEIVSSVRELVVSLQTLDSERADRWYGTGTGTHAQVLRNLDRAKEHAHRTCDIVISSVVTPENIEDLLDVFRYTQARGFRFAACPQLVGVKAHPAVTDNKEYRRFYDVLIAEKRRGARIHGTVDYLEFMRDLRKFSCRPFTMLVVSPSGEVFYPCLEIGHPVGNLLKEESLHRLRQDGRTRFGPQAECGTQCHSACALGFARLLARPTSLLHEAFLIARARFKSFR